MKKLIFIFALLFFALPATGFAAIVRSGDNVNFNNPVAENVYVSANEITVESKVIGGVVALGGTLNIENDVSGDVVAAAGSVIISANVNGNARLAAGQIVISGNVSGDVFVFGGNVEVAKNAIIGGDLIVYAGNVKIDGIIHGNLQGSVSLLKITGLVGKNVNLKINSYARVLETAKINGDFIYTSSSVIYIPESVIGGSIKRNEVAKTWRDLSFLGVRLGDIFYKFIGFLTLAVIALLIAVFAPVEFVKNADMVRGSFWKTLGVGFLVLIVVPIGAAILLVTVIGAPVALIIGAMFLIMAYVSKVFAGFFIGNLILGNAARNKWLLWARALLGLAILTVAWFVPFIGPLAVFVVWLVAFGAFTKRRWQMLKFLKEKKFF